MMPATNTTTNARGELGTAAKPRSVEAGSDPGHFRLRRYPLCRLNGCLGSVGHPSGPISRLYPISDLPPFASVAHLRAWQSRHRLCSAPSRKRFHRRYAARYDRRSWRRRHGPARCRSGTRARAGAGASLACASAAASTNFARAWSARDRGRGWASPFSIACARPAPLGARERMRDGPPNLSPRARQAGQAVSQRAADCEPSGSRSCPTVAPRHIAA
jgi:hypothetical protein